MTSVRPELPREFVAGHKRRRMMDAMAELTAEQGYEATKIADIVRRAAVARKTLYDNFDGKEDLFLSALDAMLAEMGTRIEEACERSSSSQERIEAGLEALLEFIAERPACARMLFVESISATPSSARLYDGGMRLFVELLRAGTPKVTDLPETIEESLAGGVAWIVQQQIRRQEAENALALHAELCQFVLAPYREAESRSTSARRK